MGGGSYPSGGAAAFFPPNFIAQQQRARANRRRYIENITARRLAEALRRAKQRRRLSGIWESAKIRNNAQKMFVKYGKITPRRRTLSASPTRNTAARRVRRNGYTFHVAKNYPKRPRSV